MSERTGIAWTDATWNPWQGCTKVSPGCAHCYMYREKTRYGQDPETVVRSAPGTFLAPRKWKDPRRVFTCSWSDFFHPAADAWRADAWDIIRETPHLTYQILTKRPGRIPDALPADWGKGWPHVHLGVSVESQRFVLRINALRTVPAAVRFLSAEPLLGALDLTGLTDGIGWVICGGESGPGARPMSDDWARGLRDQCAAAGVPYFLKQLGGHPNKRDGTHAILDGVTHTATPGGSRGA